MNRQLRKKFFARTKGLTFQQMIADAWKVSSLSAADSLCGLEANVHDEVLRIADGANILTGAPWFHGGVLGRATGDLLLPPEATGQDPRGLGAMVPTRFGRVYVTLSREEATGYAQNCGGVVYRVLPDALTGVDPALVRAIVLVFESPRLKPKLRSLTEKEKVGAIVGSYRWDSFTCNSAKVVEVLS